MAFCPKCGAKLLDGAKFCTSCGAPVEKYTKPVAASATNGVAPTTATATKTVNAELPSAAEAKPSTVPMPAPMPAPVAAPTSNDGNAAGPAPMSAPLAAPIAAPAAPTAPKTAPAAAVVPVAVAAASVATTASKPVAAPVAPSVPAPAPAPAIPQPAVKQPASPATAPAPAQPATPAVSMAEAFAYFGKSYVEPQKNASGASASSELLRRDPKLGKDGASKMGGLDYGTHRGGSSSKLGFGELATELVPEAAPVESMLREGTRAKASEKVHTDRLKNKVAMGEMSQQEAVREAEKGSEAAGSGDSE